MTANEKKEKRNWFLLMLGYFTFGYLIINHISTSRTSFLDVSLYFEKDIPFVPIFIFGYLFVYIGMLIVYAIINDIEDWHRAVMSFFLATTMCYTIFILTPVRMNMRPELPPDGNVSIWLTKLFYQIDLPYNCFPSLHVTYPTLATLIAWRKHLIMRWILASMALVVAVSVVLVKQHYLADVVSGLIAASASFVFTIKTESFWSGWFKLKA